MKWVSEKQSKPYHSFTIFILTRTYWVLSWYWRLWQRCLNGEDKFNSGRNSTVCFTMTKDPRPPEKSSKIMNFSIFILPKMVILFHQKYPNFRFCLSTMSSLSTTSKSWKRSLSNIWFWTKPIDLKTKDQIQLKCHRLCRAVEKLYWQVHRSKTTPKNFTHY